MCAIFSIKGKWCETGRELADALGPSQSVIPDEDMECCLCGVNPESIGARQATTEEGYPFPTYIVEAAP